MTSNVIALPVKSASSPALEADLLGALLHLASLKQFDQKTWETMRLTGEEFSTELVAKAWKIARKQGVMGQAVSALTVFTAGYSHKWFTVDAQQVLVNLVEANTMNLEQFRRVATDFRLEYQAKATAARLEELAKKLRTEAFDPARTAGALSGIERDLHRSAARIEDLTGDQMALMSRWDSNRASGKQDTLATGIKVLDAEIGGLPRLFCVLAADAGVGKTALVDSMIHSMLLTHWEQNLFVGAISPEDGVEHIVKRWLARDSGWLLREIGSKQLSPEDEERLQEINARQYEVLKRVKGYREREIRSDELVSLCWQMVDEGAGAIFIDNFNKILLPSGPEYHTAVQHFANRMSEFAEKARVPTVMVTHMTDGEVNTNGKVTATGGLQGGKAMGRVARFRMDLFRKGKALRGVIAKANELCEQGTVIEFSRQATAGLIDPDTGEKIDLNAERAQERRARQEAADAAAEAKRKKRDAERAQLREAAALKKAQAKAEAEAKKHPPTLFPEAAMKSGKTEDAPF